MAKKRKSVRLKYVDAPDLQERMVEIVRLLGMDHIDLERVRCLRSHGSSAKWTIARCHTIGKLMQQAMGVKAFYAIEFLESFDKQSKEEQDKTIIHELMHIPKTFGGGFRQHDYVCDKNVDIMHEKFVEQKVLRGGESFDEFREEEKKESGEDSEDWWKLRWKVRG